MKKCGDDWQRECGRARQETQAPIAAPSAASSPPPVRPPPFPKHKNHNQNQSKANHHAPSASLPSIALSLSAQHTAALWCPLYVRIASPVDRSHSLAVASEEAETR